MGIAGCVIVQSASVLNVQNTGIKTAENNVELRLEFIEKGIKKKSKPITDYPKVKQERD